MSDSFIVGCGYVGKKVAECELKDGGSVCALVRRLSQANFLRSHGIDTVIFDLDDSDLPPLSLHGKTLYWFAPPPSIGLIDSRIASFLVSIENHSLPSRLVLISTTGVYGDCRGKWVTESHPLRPQTRRGKCRVDAENIARRWCKKNGVPTVILRVPGIYGPSKLPIERLKRRQPVLSADQSPWSNRIHVYDLVRSCLAAARVSIDCLAHSPVICNVSDGNPSTRTEFYFAVAKSHSLPCPPVLDQEATKKMLNSNNSSYLRESKRVDNTRMREWLGVVPEFPDLNSGLSAEGLSSSSN